MRPLRKNHHRRKKPKIRIQPRRKLPKRIQKNTKKLSLPKLPKRILYTLEKILRKRRETMRITRSDLDLPYPEFLDLLNEKGEPKPGFKHASHPNGSPSHFHEQYPHTARLLSGNTPLRDRNGIFIPIED